MIRGVAVVAHIVPRAVSGTAPVLVTLAPRVALVVSMVAPLTVGDAIVGAVIIICAPPAVVEPDLVPEEKVKSVVARALTLIVAPAVGEAAISTVMKM